MTFKEYTKKYPNAEVFLLPLEGEDLIDANIRKSAYMGFIEKVPLYRVVGSLNYRIEDLKTFFGEKCGWAFDDDAIKKFDPKLAFEKLQAPIRAYENDGNYYISGEANHRAMMGAAKFNYIVRQLEEAGALTEEIVAALDKDYTIEAEVVCGSASLKLAETIVSAKEQLSEILLDEEQEAREDIYAEYDENEQKYTVYYDGEILKNADEKSAIVFVEERLRQDIAAHESE